MKTVVTLCNSLFLLFSYILPFIDVCHELSSLIPIAMHAITDAAEVGVTSIYVTNPLKFSPLYDEYYKSYPCVCEAHRHCSLNITYI